MIFLLKASDWLLKWKLRNQSKSSESLKRCAIVFISKKNGKRKERKKRRKEGRKEGEEGREEERKKERKGDGVINNEKEL